MYKNILAIGAVVLAMVVGNVIMAYAVDSPVQQVATATVQGVQQAQGAVTTVVGSTEVTETVVKLGDTLNDALKGMITSVVSAKDFLAGQVPEVITQLLWWHGIKSFLFCIVGVTIITLSIVLNKRWYKKMHVDYLCRKEANISSYSVGHNLEIPIGLGIFGIGTGVLLLSNLTWLQILVAPKLYLIEYAASLVK